MKTWNLKLKCMVGSIVLIHAFLLAQLIFFVKAIRILLN